MIESYAQIVSIGGTLGIDPTDGKEIIAEASNVFPGWIDSNFEKYGCSLVSPPTGSAQATVLELIKDGLLSEIFGGDGVDLHRLCFTQPQIIQFVQKHRKWLRTERHGTLFLFRIDKDFFVAQVYFREEDEKLRISLYKLSSKHVWRAKFLHRIVILQ